MAASGWAEYGDAALGDATACLPSFDRDCLEVPDHRRIRIRYQFQHCGIICRVFGSIGIDVFK